MLSLRTTIERKCYETPTAAILAKPSSMNFLSRLASQRLAWPQAETNSFIKTIWSALLHQKMRCLYPHLLQGNATYEQLSRGEIT